MNGEKIEENEEEEVDEKSVSKEVSMSEYSMLGEESLGSKMIDVNFTLDFSKPNAFKK